MCRFSLRTFLIVSAACSIVLGLWLRSHWATVAHSYSSGIHMTVNKTFYSVSWIIESDPFRGHRLVSAVVVPGFTDDALRPDQLTSRERPRGKGLEMDLNGVFLDGKLIGGEDASKVLISLGGDDIRVIPLLVRDIDALGRTQGNTLTESPTWKNKVEPEIDKLMRPLLRARREARGIPSD